MNYEFELQIQLLIQTVQGNNLKTRKVEYEFELQFLNNILNKNSYYTYAFVFWTLELFVRCFLFDAICQVPGNTVLCDIKLISVTNFGVTITDFTVGKLFRKRC